MLSKLLVLNDSQTREEYFRQQAEFVTEHGRGDEFTEFSTDIQGTKEVMDEKSSTFHGTIQLYMYG